MIDYGRDSGITLERKVEPMPVCVCIFLERRNIQVDIFDDICWMSVERNDKLFR